MLRGGRPCADAILARADNPTRSNWDFMMIEVGLLKRCRGEDKVFVFETWNADGNLGVKLV